MEKKEENYNYRKELENQINKDPWLQDLFNKIGKEVKVEVDSGFHIRGILKRIEFIRGVLNLEIENSGFVYFVNWRNVNYLEVKK